MFWIASARPNTSRPQSLACDMGVRKNPSVARGPKLIMEMRQPHTTITSGVRQPIVEALEADGNEMAMTANPCEWKNDRRTECSQLAAGSGGNGTQQLGSRLDREDDFFGRNVLTRSLLVRPRPGIPKRNL